MRTTVVTWLACLVAGLTIMPLGCAERPAWSALPEEAEEEVQESAEEVEEAEDEAPSFVKPAVPFHFVTHTDAAGFSISYPRDWKSITSTIPDYYEHRRRLIETLEAGRPLHDIVTLFRAGPPTDIGPWKVDPHVELSVGPCPSDFSSVEEVADWQIEGMKTDVANPELLGQVTTVVGGKRAILIDYTFNVYHIPDGRALRMTILDGNQVWDATCFASTESVFDANRQDVELVLRSLRILGIP